MTDIQPDRIRPHFETRLARDDTDLRAAQRLRYEVFVEELGARCDGADHTLRLERDALDPHFDHLLLIDPTVDPATLGHVVGVYRLLPQERAEALGRFYSDGEYDLTALRRSGRKLVELGRSCVHPAHRKGAAMLHLWNALADYVLARDIEVMFGVASFHGTRIDDHAVALSWLKAHHLAPPALRVTARPEGARRMDRIDPAALDKATALAAIPPLIRAYLRLGGFVGDGAFVDEDFNTTDVCLIMDTSSMSERAVDFYTRKTPRA
ncbi:MAG: GNAT family N-acetyltransferase [Rhodobacter sp.]|uniref:GNAT family N-acetyltransferase n=1 Tax=Pararhodobacter sp. TaxID=2127056 RepID=UPI001D9D5B56|nr:GNAT family N-acyltransferase [Pararhodobacter sp.]MCB1344166.1 GNAT family N-acetyltransferase [Paracoccaceae bacterium]MCC0074075.1 GNAT family N-acetyltransferase [Rhodobacter sp.]HPD93354.1 GNAT family N-acyltransferase [Pararhodobacter sp.]